ncbi:MAG: hypothetical protein SFT92_01805 [Rickettsiales bacterium]|nr:hypothetical protein [Rickettsiales bacterium]
MGNAPRSTGIELGHKRPAEIVVSDAGKGLTPAVDPIARLKGAEHEAVKASNREEKPRLNLIEKLKQSLLRTPSKDTSDVTSADRPAQESRVADKAREDNGALPERESFRTTYLSREGHTINKPAAQEEQAADKPYNSLSDFLENSGLERAVVDAARSASRIGMALVDGANEIIQDKSIASAQDTAKAPSQGGARTFG